MLLEPDYWPEGDPDVVVCTAVKIDLIAHIRANTERSCEHLDSATRIKHSVYVTIFQPRGEVAEGDGSIGGSESHESALREYEQPHRTALAELEFWTCGKVCCT